MTNTVTLTKQNKALLKNNKELMELLNTIKLDLSMRTGFDNVVPISDFLWAELNRVCK